MIFERKRITELRCKENLTQAEFGRMTGLDPRYLRRLEAGKKSPSFDTVVRLSWAFNVPIEEFAKDELGG